MSKRKEKISAFLDNDLHRDELMSFSLSAEPDDAELAQRYQMVGDVLRGDMSEASFVDISHAVREALADENIADEMPAASTSTAASQKQTSSGFDWSSWFRPLAGMAVAVFVAVVLVNALSDKGDIGFVEVANNTEKQPVIQVAIDSKSTDQKTMDLDPYISQHLEFATQDALQGRLPYVRAVSFEPTKADFKVIEK
jgi:negative regulator of sigma E activity